MLRPADQRAIRAGEVDLAFRRWERPRVLVGTRLRTGVGLVEVTSLERVGASRLTAADARRAGQPSLAALREALAARPELPIWRVGVAWAGPDPRESLRDELPDDAEVARLRAWLDRLDSAASYGPWTRATLTVIGRHPGRRAPDLAAAQGRETPEFKRDVRKLKEKGLTQSLDVGYLLTPRGAAVLGDASIRATVRTGTPVPRIGAGASRALAAAGIGSLEELSARTLTEISSLRGVGPYALQRLREALDDARLDYPSR